MTFKNQDRGAADSPGFIDIADLQEIISTSKEEPTQRETRRSPTSSGGRNFDIKLFNRVLDMVSEAQLDFDKAAQEDSSEEDSPSMSNGELPMPESAEESREYYTPSAAEALYRKGDSLDEPHFKPHMPVPATKGPAAERGEDVPSERVFKYGGPDNEVESWYKDYPASLPFAETFQLAHWENLQNQLRYLRIWQTDENPFPSAQGSNQLDDVGEGDVTEALNQIPAAVIPVKIKTATKSKVTKSRAATKKLTKKATIAGKVAGKAQRKVVVKEITDEENHTLHHSEAEDEARDKGWKY
ncbi:unnamed protein product [Alternaria alternata]